MWKYSVQSIGVEIKNQWTEANMHKILKTQTYTGVGVYVETYTGGDIIYTQKYK